MKTAKSRLMPIVYHPDVLSFGGPR